MLNIFFISVIFVFEKTKSSIFRQKSGKTGLFFSIVGLFSRGKGTSYAKNT